MRTRYFLTYRGVALPLTLCEELPAESLSHRNTWFEARYDAAGRLVEIDKRVYGEIELSHRYRYDDAGRLVEAEVLMGDEPPRVLRF